MPIPLFRQCNHCGREEYYKKTSPVKRHRILRLFKKVCAAQQPTAKTRQFESNSMRAAVSKNTVNTRRDGCKRPPKRFLVSVPKMKCQVFNARFAQSLS